MRASTSLIFPLVLAIFAATPSQAALRGLRNEETVIDAIAGPRQHRELSSGSMSTKSSGTKSTKSTKSSKTMSSMSSKTGSTMTSKTAKTESSGRR